MRDNAEYIRYKIGVVSNDATVNVYSEPNRKSPVVQILCYMSKVRILEPVATKGFYRVCTENGTEGFCDKNRIELTDI